MYTYHRHHCMMVISGGGFFLACGGLGRMFDHSFPACAVFFYGEISSRTLIPHFMPGSVHSGSAGWDDCGRMIPDKLRVSSFPNWFPHYAWTAAWSAHSDFVGSRVYACFGVTFHLHFWQNDRGLLRVTAVTRKWCGHRTRASRES